jgi:hypothetical protein
MLTQLLGQARRARFLIPIVVAAASLLFAGLPLRASGPATPSHSVTQAFPCTPVGVAVFTDHVHVRCSPADGAFIYFAYCSTTDSALSSRFLSAFITAKATAKQLVVYYDPGNTSGNSCGCNSNNCRVITGAEVQQ